VSFFLQGLLIIALAAVWTFAAFQAFCADSIKARWICGAIAVALMAWVLGLMIEEGSSGPCVQWETQMHYNSATKSMMPARVCVNRGEWIKEGEQ
jgi:hypothetical protein